MTREIILSKGEIALVDADMFDRLSKIKWHSAKSGHVYGSNGWTQVYMHRVVLNAPPGTEVDHINRQPLDNRRENLRLATRAQNSRNRSYPAGMHGYRGIQGKTGGRYYAVLMVDGRNVTAGSFGTAIEAAVAYDALAKKHHGEFAFLNFSSDRDWILPIPIAKPHGNRKHFDGQGVLA